MILTPSEHCSPYPRQRFTIMAPWPWVYNVIRQATLNQFNGQTPDSRVIKR